ncbi:hypothetical protein Q757_01030 [Oenococcus alcoholitolerans]|uniref:Uncharacterized protein n=1 Tax=Oenococcus alcoholitolerans TaxID=931074 RepID=A0ABR4XTL3_9LACO|nr:hypothetical protein Q757_01030 [Oenococcus alcoholitolerans]
MQKNTSIINNRGTINEKFLNCKSRKKGKDNLVISL